MYGLEFNESIEYQENQVISGRINSLSKWKLHNAADVGTAGTIMACKVYDFQ